MTHLPSSFARRSVAIWFGGAAFLGASLFSIANAQAGTLADVRLVESRTGQVLPVYRHRGELWVAGRPGANYSVDITNRTGARILAVVSVDGVNAITGKTASAAPDDGYVLNPWQNWLIAGWRKSNSQVATFYFSESDASYAARTGRPQNVGVIGVALFRERRVEPVRPLPPPVSRRAPSYDEREMASADAAASSAPSVAAPAPVPQAAPRAEMNAESASPANSRMAEKRADYSAKPAPSLGTGHGALESSHTRDVEFDAATRSPEQIVQIRYDSYANLVAKGVIPAPRPDRSPNPFPAPDRSGFVPDPPRW